MYKHKNGQQFIKDLENSSLHYVNRVKRKEGIKEICSNRLFVHAHSNILCDKTKGVQLINEIKNDVVNGFESTTMNGVLCHEQIRGVKFNILDCKIHSDKVHRNAGVNIPMTRKCIYASQNGVYNTLNPHRYCVIDQEANIGTSLLRIEAQLPVCESFGFINTLKKNTQQKRFPCLSFSHWSIIDGIHMKMKKRNEKRIAKIQ